MARDRTLGFSSMVLRKKFRAGMTVRAIETRRSSFRKEVQLMLSTTSKAAR